MLLLELFSQVALAADEANDFTLMEIWHHSGWIARSVIVMLLTMLLAGMFVTVERLIAFGRARSQSMMAAAQVSKPLQANDIATALKIVKGDAYKSSYLAAILKSGLQEMDLRADQHGISNAKRAVEKAMTEERGKLMRGMTILATVGSTAPFVGLFGTTFGVINAFQGMSGGSAGLANISAGISEALITTAVGIGVAVLGVWAFNYFNARIAKVTEEMESSEAEFMDWANKLVQPSLTSQAGK